MGDLKTANTSYPTSLDTYTPIADVTDEVVASHINGALSAIIAMETELGAAVKGSATDLATRLSKNIHADGGVLRGTSFPGSPPDLPHLFWRTDTTPKQLYIYDTALASYQRIDSPNDHGALVGLADDDHTQYVHNSSARTITAQHSFAPAAPAAPFALNANAQGQLVTGLRAATAASADSATTATTATTATQVTDGTNNIRTKIIEIGDWDMDLTDNVSIAHGLTLANIRQVDAMIKNDSPNTAIYNIVTGSSSATAPAGIITTFETNVNLIRIVGGSFDTSAFNETSYNRGWITITYVV